MKAVRLAAADDIAVEDIAEPVVADDGVIVRVERAGVCGTDLEIMRGEFPANPPVTMGHEYAGVVTAVGASVADIAPGDRVTSAGAWGCGTCEACLDGQPGLCRNRTMLGATADGAFAEFVHVPARAVVPLPEGLDADAAQSMLGVAVCLRGLSRTPVPAGARVAVSGPGHLGLILVQVLRHVTAAPVTLFGTRDERLALGRRWGSATVNVRTDDWHDHASTFDVVFETAGTPESFLQAIELAAPGARICVLGVAKAPLKDFAPAVFYEKELAIIGSKGGSGEYREALRLLADRVVEIEPLITHRFPIDAGVEALKTASDRNQLPIRVVIESA